MREVVKRCHWGLWQWTTKLTANILLSVWLFALSAHAKCARARPNCFGCHSKTLDLQFQFHFTLLKHCWCSNARLNEWNTMNSNGRLWVCILYIDYVNQFFTSTIKHWPLELPQVFLASFLYFCVIPISVSFASLLPFSYAYVGRLAAGRTKAIECVCALTKRAARCDPCHHISYHLVQCCRWSCLIYWCWAAAGL